MHININDILAQDIGYSRSYEIQGEMPALELVKLVAPITGSFTLTRTEQGVFAAGKIKTTIELECHRCLNAYNHHVELGFAQSFCEQPGDEDMPITKGSIDLAPVIDQEIAVRLPIKLLCSVDCEGVPGASKEYTKEESKG
jgi:uncharacterized protein